MHVGRLNQDLQQLRRYRTRPEPDLAISTPLQDICRDLQRQQRKAGNIAEAWTMAIPPGLVERTEIVTFARGVLSVRVQDAATRYQLDRFLRAGGEAEVARLARAAIRKIKLV